MWHHIKVSVVHILEKSRGGIHQTLIVNLRNSFRVAVLLKASYSDVKTNPLIYREVFS